MADLAGEAAGDAAGSPPSPTSTRADDLAAAGFPVDGVTSPADPAEWPCPDGPACADPECARLKAGLDVEKDDMAAGDRAPAGT